MHARSWIKAIAFLAVAGWGSFLVPVDGTTNCGGNMDALGVCESYQRSMWCKATYDYPGQPFLITNVPARARAEFEEVARPDSWTRDAHYLVSTEPFFPTKSHDDRILIVCDRCYTNVPRHWFWQAPPTHAVCYCDGRTGLISAADFAMLDTSKFKRLEELFPAARRWLDHEGVFSHGSPTHGYMRVRILSRNGNLGD